MAAPTATTSSGFTPRLGFLPKNFSTISCTLGIRVLPPTKITSSISPIPKPASFKAASQGTKQRVNKLSASCSNLARLNFSTRCLGTPSTAVMYGRLISVSLEEESSTFAFSAASFKRCKAIGSLRRSIFSCDLNSSANQSMITLSKSSPPRCVSPFVDFTSNTPSPNSRIEISNVPPPRSNTAIF